MQRDETYDLLIQRRGPAYREDQIVTHSHYQDPIDRSSGRFAGNSHVWGDASAYVQSRVIDALIDASHRAGLDAHQTAYVFAIARAESGFNPDAAAGTTSAYGLGQFVDRTAASYGLNDGNRADVHQQARALVEHYIDNERLAKARGKSEEHIYKYHHDGPSQDYGGWIFFEEKSCPGEQTYVDAVVEQSETPDHCSIRPNVVRSRLHARSHSLMAAMWR